MGENIKKLLKDARDSIGQKNYEEAQRICCNILNKDKNNYMALVLYGVSLQDNPKAIIIFQQAISLYNDKPLAYQGLQSFYEKHDDENYKKQLLPIYNFIMKTENDIQKFEETLNKSIIIIKTFKDLDSIINLWQIRHSFDEAKKKLLFPELIALLTDNVFDVSDNILQIFEDIFLEVEPQLIRDGFVVVYLNYLANSFVDNLPKIIAAVKKYETVSSKEWFCKKYLYYTVVMHYPFTEEATKLAEDYCNSQLSSEVIISMNALILFKKGDYISSYSCLQKMFDSGFDGIDISLLKSYCCLKLKRWNESKITIAKLLDNNSSDISDIAKTVTRICQLQASSSSNEPFDCSCNYRELDLFGKTFSLIKSERWREAEDCISQMSDNIEAAFLYSLLLEAKKFPEEAIEHLQLKISIDPCFWFPLALLYWNKNLLKKAIVPLLHSAKRDQQNFHTFLLLGHYYNGDGDFEKAKKCYLKSYTLNPECTESGKYLSEVYRKLQNWNENLEFLAKVAKNTNIADPWASLELGLHYFALQEWDKCIINLRNYVRNSSEDVSAWETLADAYYSRGSFTSALKSYQKILEFKKQNKYTLVQIACIQNLLSQFDEALETFSSVEDEFYIPAIKGRADVHFSIALQNYTDNSFGSSRDHAQKSYDILVKALSVYPKFVCFWKKMAEVAVLISKLPRNFCYLKTTKKDLKNEDIYNLAIECYSSALKLEPNINTHLYYELSCVYYDSYKKFGSKININKALFCIKLCLEAEKFEWRFWNILGLICMTEEIKKYNVAQHAFIKASQLDVSNATIWSNIGVLYYCLGNKILSNKALKKAQQFNPDCYQSWIGQALIAESVNHDDAMDLFRHSTQLGFHFESTVGYAEWVCKTIYLSKAKLEEKHKYAIVNMNAVPLAFDLISGLYKYDKQDSCVLNIYGVLLEKMGLLNEARNIYEMSLNTVDDANRDIVLLNFGRVLTRLKDFDKAIAVLKSISEINSHSVYTLAYCLYKNSQFEESFQLYSSSTQWFADDDVDKSELFVMLAALCYKSSDLGDPQAYLFQGIQQCGTTIPLLLSMFSLSSLISALPLTQLVIAEFSKQTHKNDYLKYVTLVETYFKKDDNIQSATRKLAKYVHQYPDQHYLWQYLSRYQIGGKIQKPMLASRCAQKSIALNDCKDNITKDIKTVSFAELCLGNIQKCKIYAQKAIQAKPEDAESWALLLGAELLEKPTTSKMQNLLKTIELIDNSFEPTRDLKQWLNSWSRTLSVSVN